MNVSVDKGMSYYVRMRRIEQYRLYKFTHEFPNAQCLCGGYNRITDTSDGRVSNLVAFHILPRRVWGPNKDGQSTCFYLDGFLSDNIQHLRCHVELCKVSDQIRRATLRFETEIPSLCLFSRSFHHTLHLGCVSGLSSIMMCMQVDFHITWPER